MNRLSLALIGGIAVMAAPLAGLSQDVPDAFSVEWQRSHPCEKLYEDAQIRIGRCTFPPGAIHVRHTHPGYFLYTLSGGKGEVKDARGTRQSENVTGSYFDVPPVPWHDFANIGDTTISYLLVEKKYQPVPQQDVPASK
jgi:quercetin dioxygenase-like cupin family protein